MISGGHKVCVSSAPILSDEEQLTASIKLSDKGDLEGDDNLFRREFYMTGDGNCALYSMGTTHTDTKNLFLANSNDIVVRNLAHLEIVDEFKELPQQMKVKQNYITLKEDLDRVNLCLQNTPRNPANHVLRQNLLTEQTHIRARIAAYAKQKETYEDYVNYSLVNGHYMLFREDVGGSRETYFIDALAHLLNKNLIIWSQINPLNGFEILTKRPGNLTQHNNRLIRSHQFFKSGGNGTLEIIHRGDHYNRVVSTNNPESLRKAVQDEETSIRRIMTYLKAEQIADDTHQKQAQLIAAQKKKAEDDTRQKQTQLLADQKKKTEVDARQKQAQLLTTQKKKAEDDAHQKQAQLIAAQKKKAEDDAHQKQTQILAATQKAKAVAAQKARAVAAQKARAVAAQKAKAAADQKAKAVAAQKARAVAAQKAKAVAAQKARAVAAQKARAVAAQKARAVAAQKARAVAAQKARAVAAQKAKVVA
ncbi:hypothetical protein Cva_00981 [Caedimonas varicaedens]|uniref:Uncharacterized protein n=1 Tax=Caedimonas varicaedens TaxID=1629334 RepID=A0A0K8MCY4_9PROT|nr:hypothetical protein Cva_00981 [Caedimonas varicaedens]